MKYPIRFAAVLASVACAGDPATAPRAVPFLPPPSLSVLPRGYGFTQLPGGTNAVANADGATRKCSQSGSGARSYVLTLTPSMVVNAQDILAAGGTAEVEVFTKFQYVGNGVLTANATIDVTSNGSSIGSENHSGSAKNPGCSNGGQIEAGYDYFPVPLADFKAGNQIEVDLTGQVTAVVNVCRAPWGAFARWTAGMPVLRLTP